MSLDTTRRRYLQLVGLAGDTVSVASNLGTLYAVSTTEKGTQRWTARTDGVVIRSPAIADGTVYIPVLSAAAVADGTLYIGSIDSTLYALTEP